MNEDFVYTQHPKLDYKNIDGLAFPKQDGTSHPFAWEDIFEGTDTDYDSFYNFLANNPLSIPANYEYFLTQADENELLNYYVTQVFYGNGDWPGNNQKVWKYKGQGGKWRWIMYDLDGSVGYYENGRTYRDRIYKSTCTNCAYQSDPISTLPFRSFFEAPNYKNQFIQRMNTYMNVIWSVPRTTAIIDSMHAIVRPEMNYEIARWGGSDSTLWENRIQTLKTFMLARPAGQRTHIDTSLNQNGTYPLTLNFDASSNGHVNAHTNHFNLPFNYSGLYHKNVPFRLKAEPNPGYRFVMWQETGSNDASILVNESAATTLTPIFTSDQDIIINEIYYNPIGTSEDEEFIELYNPSAYSRDISGYEIDKGVCFKFPVGSIIGPQEYIVLTKDETIYNSNGYQVFEWSNSSLSNSGEKILLINSRGQEIDSVSYDDTTLWPVDADGNGYSLALLASSLDNALAPSWDIQLASFITPGAVNVFCPPIVSSISTTEPSCSQLSDGLSATTCYKYQFYKYYQCICTYELEQYS